MNGGNPIAMTWHISYTIYSMETTVYATVSVFIFRSRGLFFQEISGVHASIIVHVDFDDIREFHYKFVTWMKSA